MALTRARDLLVAPVCGDDRPLTNSHIIYLDAEFSSAVASIVGNELTPIPPGRRDCNARKGYRLSSFELEYPPVAKGRLIQVNRAVSGAS